MKKLVILESFKNPLKISYKEHDHVLKVWNIFEIKTMKNYCDLYLKCDVLLLADISEKFTNNRLWIMSEPLLQLTRLRLACNAENDKS